MTAKDTSLSDSGAQQRAEAEILTLAESALGCGSLTALDRPSFRIGDRPVRVDGVTVDGSVVVEAYAHQGKLRGGQPNKIARDILKLGLIRRDVRVTRAVVVLASDEALRSLTGWVRAAADELGVEVISVQPSAATVAALLTAQSQQVMVNLSRDEAEALGSIDSPQPED